MNIRPPVRYHGGDYYEAPWLISHFPAGYENMRYGEAFGGAASVLLQKNPSRVELYNDIDKGIYTLFKVIREKPEELNKVLSTTPYHQEEWLFCRQAPQVADEVEMARRTYVMLRQSAAGRNDQWAYTKSRTRRGMADVVSGWLSSIHDNLPVVVERLTRVQFHNEDFRSFIARFDGPDMLWYLDPSYLPETRAKGSEDVYACEMTEADHRDLSIILNNIQGKVILAGYESPQYKAWYSSWNMYSNTMDVKGAKVTKDGVKSSRDSCIWVNYTSPVESSKTLMGILSNPEGDNEW